MDRFKLDLFDPMVREMAETNHVPTEVWTPSGYVTVTCETCHQEWPCMTRTQLNKMETP